jgi:phosphatidate cytidylyltransferase
MLRWRLILGALFIALLVGLCILDFRAEHPGTYLGPLAVLLSLVGANELMGMFRKGGHDPLAWVVYVGTLVTVVIAGAPAYLPNAWLESPIGRLGWLAIGLAAGLLLAMIGELVRYESPGRAVSNLSLECFAIFYMGGLMGFLMQLRLLGGGQFGNDGRWGMLALVSLIATVKMSDTGQYTAGRLWGKHKLAPRVSPGKTWQGVAGGVVIALATAWLVLTWGANKLVGQSATGSGPMAVCLFAILVAAAGIVGDLAESLLKRDSGVKDSSTWLPGFGGVLDLLDSLLGAAPVVYVLWASGVVRP